MNLSPENKLILSSVKINPLQADLDRIDKLITLIQDWEYFTNNIIDRCIAPLFLAKIPLLANAGLIPLHVKTKLQQAYYKTLSRNIVLYEAFRKIAIAFMSADIEIITLKGIYLAEWLYGDIGLRQMSDIDLLVKEVDGDKSLGILSEMGYSEYDDSVTDFTKSKMDLVHYSPMIQNNISVEIHIKLHHNDVNYKLDIKDLWLNAQPVTINKTEVKTLQLNDLLIYICVHLDKHFKIGHIQFTSINDIVNILDKFADSLNWNRIEERCMQFGCENEFFKYIILVTKFFDVSIPSEIIQKYESFLLKKDIRMFYNYLSGYRNLTAIPTHVGNIKEIDNLADTLRYLWDIIFPPKAFMIKKYNITHPTLFIFYYPYRYYIGLKGFLFVLLKR